ncbi:MAG: hypothetical protein AAF449_10910 [Myxococcota bacterium]
MVGAVERPYVAPSAHYPEDTRVGTELADLREVLDDEPSSFTLDAWRQRNRVLFDVLVDGVFIDPEVVTVEAHEFLNRHLIHHRVGAASDTQNAGHVRAQNQNIIHYAVSIRAPPGDVAIAMQAGFIHDLNKAFGEPLRADRFAPYDQRGRPIRSMTTMAQIVGLNHLGERTRRALELATRLDVGPLLPEVAEQIDHCIIHHGLGSSLFIRNLVDGDNPWWGPEFVDPSSGVRRVMHPEPPPMTLASVLHDLADSTQQMQGGAAWLMKYPSGYWRAAGRPYASMLSERHEAEDQGVQMSLAKQIQEETATCHGIIAQAQARGIITAGEQSTLMTAVQRAAQPSIDWVSDDPGVLEVPTGMSAYHDVGRLLAVSAPEAQVLLQDTVPGTADGDRIEEALWASARRLDSDRADALVAMLSTSFDDAL